MNIEQHREIFDTIRKAKRTYTLNETMKQIEICDCTSCHQPFIRRLQCIDCLTPLKFTELLKKD